MKYRRYAEYKDSGVEWLGKVPAHWDLRRTKFLFELMNRLPQETDEIVTAFRDGAVTLRSNRRIDGFTNSLKEIGYQGVRKGDLVIHAMDGFAGAIGVADSDGKSTPVYSVCRPVSNEVSAYYYAKVLRHMALSGFINSLAKGIRERSTEFRWAEASNLFLPVPPGEEQQAIMTFLDRETAQIDALIAKQERLIAVLQEKRQAVISHAVTKGLNPDAPMKDSGVEWLGEVPAHWELTPIKHTLLDIIDTEHKTAPFYPDGDYLVVRTSNVKNGKLVLEDAKYTDEAGYVEWTRRGKPDPGDILFTREAPAGEACIVPADACLCLGQRMVLFKVNRERLEPQFGVWSIYGGVGAEYIDNLSQGSTVVHFNMSDIGQIPVFLPPLEEQRTIIDVICRKLAHLDDLALKAELLISKLQERRSALITAAVTGKIDVCNQVN